MTRPGPPCVFLPWDTDFFGVRIARVEGDRLTHEDVAAAIRWAEGERIDCLYALVDAGDTPSLRALEAQRFELADLRWTLEREVPPGAAAPPDAARLAVPDDRAALAALARTSHRNTRFHEDARFDAARADEMYAVWITKALDDPDALVLVPPGVPEPAGYLALHAVSAPDARIGLIAVAPALQGGGRGEALVAAGLAHLSRAGVRRVSVVTQGRNPRAIRFYERCGFRTASCRFWYHRWFQR